MLEDDEEEEDDDELFENPSTLRSRKGRVLNVRKKDTEVALGIVTSCGSGSELFPPCRLPQEPIENDINNDTNNGSITYGLKYWG